MKIYSNSSVDTYVSTLVEKGFDLCVIEEGSLTSYGLAILTKAGKKSLVITERYLNDWSSGVAIRKYNKLPKKYQSLLDNN